ncbi:MAG TPA: SLBB domain-containing protein [Sphingomonas sp.]|uniref:polysaccharide biosynthesis/export family protein n=1 Tax=Sphingomonas sp. TaxID=28214 RepID=UPI002EDAE310
MTRALPGAPCRAAIVALIMLSGCAGKLDYAPQPQIALTPVAPALVQDINRKLGDVLASDGDFHANDLIRLTFPYFPLLTTDQRVQFSGTISPPLLEPVQTRGLTTTELQAILTARYRAKLEQPSVSVSILQYNRPPPPPELFVIGEVVRPGAFPYREGTSLFEGLARAGGGNRDADLSRVVLLSPQGGTLVARMVDMQAVLGGRAGTTETLAPFSILLVPPTRIARDTDRSRQIRAIIGFNGVNVGSAVTLIQP